MLSFLEKAGFEKSLRDPDFFRQFTRPALYVLYGDPERIHEEAIRAMNEYASSISRPDYPSLNISIKGVPIFPFGTAAGFDKNADALYPLSRIFGFQETGTIVVNPREGNPRPRVAVDNANEDLFNAQGFPSKGLDYAEENLIKYRGIGGIGVIDLLCN